MLCLGLESEDFQRKEDNLRVIEKNNLKKIVDFTKDKDAAIDGGKVEQAQGHSVQNLGLGGFKLQRDVGERKKYLYLALCEIY